MFGRPSWVFSLAIVCASLAASGTSLPSVVAPGFVLDDVAVVASCLGQGPSSQTVPGRTDLPELPGFPVFSGYAAAPCAVGDVDGDGTLDIVVGSDMIYVWNLDGTELRDGDGDPSTIGPISSLTGDFGVAGITLADLDALPGLEIIVSEFRWPDMQHAVHVLRADGTELPGWPQRLRPVIDGCNRATPAVGGVDEESGPEIVVNTMDARTWVWHADGSELRDGDNDPTTNGVFLVRQEFPNEWGTSSPALFDLDGDGAAEIIFGTRYPATLGNKLLAYRYDGTVPGPPSAFPYFTGDGSILCSPTVADLNHDGSWEIIFLALNDLLYVVQQDGTDYPGFPVPMYCHTPNSTPSPAVGNFDGDEDLEIVVIATSSADLAFITVIDTDIDGGSSGTILSGWPQAVPGASEASPVVADLNGDGGSDVLHAIGGSSSYSPYNIYAFLTDGESLDGFPITLTAPARCSATICDLDADGDVDLVQNAWDGLLHVWDLSSPLDPADAFWPTFRGNVQRDGVYKPPEAAPVADPVIDGHRLVVTEPYPNPFNPLTTARTYLPGPVGEQVPFTAAIYDLQGRQVRLLHDGVLATGWHTWVWDGRDEQGRQRASGIYFLLAESRDQLAVKKLVLVR